MVKTQKPKRKIDQRNQINKFKEELERIKGLEFDKNKDQKSGDSGDYEKYADVSDWIISIGNHVWT